MGDYREEKHWGTLIFRKNKRECRREKADEVRVKGNHYTDDIWWPWPESEPTIKMIEQVAKGAYATGERHARERMRTALGIIDSTDYEGNDHVRLE